METPNDGGSAAGGPVGRLTDTLRAIGGAKRAVHGGGDGGAPELIPCHLEQFDPAGLVTTAWAREHVRWMLQKDRLDQVTCYLIYTANSVEYRPLHKRRLRPVLKPRAGLVFSKRYRVRQSIQSDCSST